MHLSNSHLAFFLLNTIIYVCILSHKISLIVVSLLLITNKKYLDPVKIPVTVSVDMYGGRDSQVPDLHQ